MKNRKKSTWRGCAVLIVLLAGNQAGMAEEPPSPIEVMVLGTYHMGNPGQDLHNIRVDPVTTDQKQAEIQAMVDAIARFRPTAVALEREASDPATMLDPKFPQFRKADLRTDQDERVQVGYRLADQLGLKRVYAIDEQAGPNEPDYFPYDKVAAWAQAHGRSGELEAFHARMQSEVAQVELDQKHLSVTEMIIKENLPEAKMGSRGHANLYYKSFLPIGSGNEQPGADLNGRWYTRNAKIFAKLMQVARPADRLVVIYGSGHNYWLRHFATTMPGYVSVDPLVYLRPTAPPESR